MIGYKESVGGFPEQPVQSVVRIPGCPPIEVRPGLQVAVGVIGVALRLS